VQFARVLKEIKEFLESHGHRYSLIGGHALATYGLSRSTLDLDLVVDAEAQTGVVAFLERLGYETRHRSTGYSNHLHPEPDRGRVDLVYVRGETAQQLFSNAGDRRGPGGIEIPVPSPEHLAAMKVLAIKNDPSRRLQELADIRFLLHLPGTDRGRVKDYFKRHGLAAEFEDVDERA
jgi:hypothetical protein